jgi:uncharacterized membrane protein
MATLAAFKFNDAQNAGYAVRDLVDLHERRLTTILDAALVSWPKGKSTPRTVQGVIEAGAGKLDGSFWGMLFGLIFFTPLMRSSIGAFRGALGDIGIHDKFIYQVRNKVREGTSALFVLSTDDISDEVTDAFNRQPTELITTNLPHAEENRLRELFAQTRTIRNASGF